MQVFRKALCYLHCYIIYIQWIYHGLFEHNFLFTQMTYASNHKNRSARFAHLTVQRHHNDIRRWANEWSININAEKTKAVVFSKRTRLQLLALKLHGDDNENVPRCPYLGVILDHKMSSKAHVDVLRGKAHVSVTIIEIVSSLKIKNTYL